ncbi:hypothetical protein GCM10027073_73790 [Streptomyces chlorus]
MQPRLSGREDPYLPEGIRAAGATVGVRAVAGFPPVRLLTATIPVAREPPSGHQGSKVNERLRAHMRGRALTLHCGNHKWDHFAVP